MRMLLTTILFSFPFKIAFAFISSLAISVYGHRKKSLSAGGAVAAIAVGFTLTLANYCFFACLLVFFVSSSFWTKWRSARKKKLEADFKEGGQRSWIQVLCNGGLPFLVSIIYLMEIGCNERPVNYAKDFVQSSLAIVVLGSIACCNGDTWSSEIGVAIGTRTPRLITTLKKVPIGTNGAISLIGTVASIFGGLLIGIVYYLTLTAINLVGGFAGRFPAQWPLILLGCFAGFFGSILDSILGATLQFSGFCERQRKVVSQPSPTVKHICGRKILSNDLVNLISSSLSGIVTSYIGYTIWRYLEESM